MVYVLEKNAQVANFFCYVAAPRVKTGHATLRNMHCGNLNFHLLILSSIKQVRVTKYVWQAQLRLKIFYLQFKLYDLLKICNL